MFSLDSTPAPFLPTHDGIFKLVFQDPAHAAPFLRWFVPPAIVDDFAWAQTELLSGEHIGQELRPLHSDLFFSVPVKPEKLAKHGGKGEICIHVSLEHQSTVERNMVVRCFMYAASMYRLLFRQDPNRSYFPAIHSVVVYTGQRPWTAPRKLTDVYGLSDSTVETMGSGFPQLQYDLMDLSQTDEQALLKSDQPEVNKLALLLLKNARHSVDLPKQMGTWRIEFRKVYAKQGQDAVLPLLFYCLTTNPHLDLDDIMELAHSIFEPHQAQAMQGELQGAWYRHADKCRQEGLQKGRQEGRQEGHEAGQRELLQRLLVAKFGALSTQLTSVLQTATSDQLTRWSERLLTADSLDEVLQVS